MSRKQLRQTAPAQAPVQQAKTAQKVITVTSVLGVGTFWNEGNLALVIDGNTAKVYRDTELVGAFCDYASVIVNTI